MTTSTCGEVYLVGTDGREHRCDAPKGHDGLHGSSNESRDLAVYREIHLNDQRTIADLAAKLRRLENARPGRVMVTDPAVSGHRTRSKVARHFPKARHEITAGDLAKGDLFEVAGITHRVIRAEHHDGRSRITAVVADDELVQTADPYDHLSVVFRSGWAINAKCHNSTGLAVVNGGA